MIDTEIGSLFIDDKHQEIMDLTACSDILYWGIKHFAKDTNLVAPIKYISYFIFFIKCNYLLFMIFEIY